MQVFGTFPDSSGRSFHVLGGVVVFSMKKCRTPRARRMFFRSALRGHFSQRRAPKGPQGDSQDPPRGAKIRCFFLGRRPGQVWKKWRTPRAKRVFRKCRRRGTQLALLHFSSSFRFFWSPGGVFWTPLGGPFGRLGDLFGSVGAKRVIFFAPRGAP